MSLELEDALDDLVELTAVVHGAQDDRFLVEVEHHRAHLHFVCSRFSSLTIPCMDANSTNTSCLRFFTKTFLLVREILTNNHI